ncbi:hypothetical protein Tco_0704801 [Tanacetum coccineum]|uniref:Reverse transcriptase domain-containing protein n=1 Tax=Tanacetum coccineum TaxID=301880 RepID=A0ABQ4Y3N8_9ASTR
MTKKISCPHPISSTRSLPTIEVPERPVKYEALHTTGNFYDVAELKDMVKALLLDRNNQSPASYSRKAVVQPPAYQAPAYQAPAPQIQGVSKEDFQAYVKANDAVMRNMQTQGQNMQNQLTNLTDMLSKFVTSKYRLLRGTSPYSRREPQGHKGIDAYYYNNGSTKDVNLGVPVVHHESISEPVNAPVSASRPNQKASIPFPSRRNDERRREKANDQIEKFYEIF